MEEERLFSVGIDGVSLSHGRMTAEVVDLPGCGCVVTEAQELDATLPAVIAEHLVWLRTHGINAGDPSSIKYEIVETVESLPSDIADGEFCFESDLLPVDPAEIEEAIDLMSVSRRDLIAVINGLPDLVLDFSPPQGSLQTDEWAPEARSIRNIISHVAGAEGYYRSNITDKEVELTDQERRDLSVQRGKLLERLRSLKVEELGRVFEKSHAWQQSQHEVWTVRKAIRRVIRHERFHTKEIEQRLAWLLIGHPSLR